MPRAGQSGPYGPSHRDGITAGTECASQGVGLAGARSRGARVRGAWAPVQKGLRGKGWGGVALPAQACVQALPFHFNLKTLKYCVPADN